MNEHISKCSSKLSYTWETYEMDDSLNNFEQTFTEPLIDYAYFSYLILLKFSGKLSQDC